MKKRIIVVPIIQNLEGQYLICKMPPNRGVYPGQWALPGGGIEPQEQMYEALNREIKEELGINIIKATPWTFCDDIRTKIYPDASQEQVYMIYLTFDCITNETNIILNDEFEEYRWVYPDELKRFDLNAATKKTFENKKLLL